MNKSLNNLKDDHSDFDKDNLSDDLPMDPFELFNTWFEEANKGNDIEVNACSLSTINIDNQTPSSRIVYLKEIISNQFVFYTNYNSQKGTELSKTPNANMLFFWPHKQRQISIKGKVSKLSSEKSDAYFASRPKSSQIGAWASKQSEFIESKQSLLNTYLRYEDDFKGKEIPRPPHWGGYALEAQEIEFWQGRPSRFHDRINYSKSDKSWIINRKNP
tara:strand:- start:353 stop:1003 length:651 start_codon:yes stop_codon:yes gene_type:complete